MNWLRNRVFIRGLVVGQAVTVTLVFLGNVVDNRRKKKKLKLKEESSAAAQPEGNEDIVRLDRGREILKYGTPEAGSHIRYYSNHVLVYNQQTRTPIWVAEHLTADNLIGAANRKSAKFGPDPAVNASFSAQNTDYWKSGWSRGHMAPAGNNKVTQEAMQDSFYLSNIVPQNLDNNAAFWNRLEMYCRNLTKTFPNVYIISGPLMVPEMQEGGKKVVNYQVLGNNDVAVPTHLFKVIVVEDRVGKPAAIGSFVVPNEPIGFQHHLKEYEVNLCDLEHALGVRLLPNFNSTSVDSLCNVDGCRLIGKDEFELYFIGRKLESANTMHRVEKVWSELEDKKLKPDKDLKDLHKRKIKELSEH